MSERPGINRARSAWALADLITARDAKTAIDYLVQVLRTMHSYEDCFASWDADGTPITHEASDEVYDTAFRRMNEAEQAASGWLVYRFGLNPYDRPITWYGDKGRVKLK